MSRNRRVSGTGTMASSLLAVDRIREKESSYRDGIAKNQAASKLLAEMLAIDGELSNAIQAATDPSARQEIETSIQEQRERLQKIAEKNVMNSRNVDAFIGALSAVRTQVQSNPETEEPLDYERIIQDKMQQFTAAHAGTQLNIHDEKFCREIRSSLGIKDHASRAKNGDDSDEELEVLRHPAGTQSLKCPITASLYEEPLRNKVCGHVYSKAGIMQMLRARQTNCPVAGCRNRQVTMEQLEDDMETAMKVKRQRRREETERQQRASQAIYDDSDEEVL